MGLGPKPKLMQEAERSYIGENDVLSALIASHCEQGRDLRAETTAFKQLYEDVTETRITMKALSQKMSARGFKPDKKRLASGQNARHVFMGLRIVT